MIGVSTTTRMGCPASRVLCEKWEFVTRVEERFGCVVRWGVRRRLHDRGRPIVCVQCMGGDAYSGQGKSLSSVNRHPQPKLQP